MLSALAGPASAETQALADYQKAQTNLKTQPESPKAGWTLGRTCFDLAEFATNNSRRAELAQEGINACRQALARDSNSAPAHYYLGLNLGQLARTRGLSALKIIKEMEREWTRAVELDPKFDYAGPERSLGMLYRDAPSIASVGNRTKARQQLARAIELAPHYPDNRLELIAACLKWGDRAGAQRELKALEDVLPAARAELKGPTWATSWSDWDTQLDQFKKKTQEPTRLETPRH